MKTIRRGLGRGKGMGYKNLVPQDRPVHQMSARGIRQPQKINGTLNLLPKKPKVEKQFTRADAQEVVTNLQIKSEDSSARMPSIINIHKMLDFYGVEHRYYGSTNVVTFRSGQRRYVNSRHEGKQGHEIKIFHDYDKDLVILHLDTSDSYYSWNSYRYAQRLLEILKERGKIQ